MATPRASRDAQLRERQNMLRAQSALLRQRARYQTARVLAPLEQVQHGMQWIHQAMPRNALWVLSAASLLFGKTRAWGLKALRLWRLWRTLRAWFGH
jgi:hypothetical protein